VHGEHADLGVRQRVGRERGVIRKLRHQRRMDDCKTPEQGGKKSPKESRAL